MYWLPKENAFILLWYRFEAHDLLLAWLLLAETAVCVHSVVPSFTADSVQSIEYTARVVFILDGEKLGVIAAVECLLKVGLVDVTLVEVSATSGRKVLQLFHPHIRNLLLQGDIGVVVHLVVWHAEDNIHQRGAESWIDSVLDILREG